MFSIMLFSGTGASSRQPSKSSPSSAPQQPGEPSEEDVARAFSVYDRDGTGEVSVLDLQGEFENQLEEC